MCCVFSHFQVNIEYGNKQVHSSLLSEADLPESRSRGKVRNAYQKVGRPES